MIQRLRQPDLSSGWGIRTLSREMPSHNPISYHNGSVWPHDNALIALGMRRYGADAPAAEIAGAMVDAAGHFDLLRLPELFCGFARTAGRAARPVAYPVSCSP